MRVTRWVLLAASGLLLAQQSMNALTDADISRAVAIAGSPEGSRSKFHAPYIVAVNGPNVEQIEVVTEFRRFVLLAEEQLKLGNWMVAHGGYDRQGRTLKDLARPSAGHVVIRARVRFHPLNTYREVPLIDILLGEPTLLALDVTRTPNLSLPSDDASKRQFIEGATIEAAFNAPSVNDRVLPVRVVSGVEELGRVTVDFSRLE